MLNFLSKRDCATENTYPVWSIIIFIIEIIFDQSDKNVLEFRVKKVLLSHNTFRQKCSRKLVWIRQKCLFHRGENNLSMANCQCYFWDIRIHLPKKYAHLTVDHNQVCISVPSLLHYWATTKRLEKEKGKYLALGFSFPSWSANNEKQSRAL